MAVYIYTEARIIRGVKRQRIAMFLLHSDCFSGVLSESGDSSGALSEEAVGTLLPQPHPIGICISLHHLPQTASEDPMMHDKAVIAIRRDGVDIRRGWPLDRKLLTRPLTRVRPAAQTHRKTGRLSVDSRDAASRGSTVSVDRRVGFCALIRQHHQGRRSALSVPCSSHRGRPRFAPNGGHLACLSWLQIA